MANNRKDTHLDPDTLEKEAQVLSLRRLGATFDQIAKQLGYASGSGAYMAYRRACLKIIYEEVEETRKMEMDRLDNAQTRIMPQVNLGNIPAINALLRIMERRARLLGLDMPIKHDVEVNYFDSDSIDAEVKRLAALLDGSPTQNYGLIRKHDPIRYLISEMISAVG